MLISAVAVYVVKVQIILKFATNDTEKLFKKLTFYRRDAKQTRNALKL